MYGLIIRDPWIGYILDGTKAWEMRTAPTLRRGHVALIRKGSGLVVGTAEIMDSLPPLDAASLAATRDRHRIPAEMDREVLAAGWVHPWVLRGVRRLPRPVPAGQKAGQVIWVPFNPDVATAVDIQIDKPRPPSALRKAVLRPMRTVPATSERTTSIALRVTSHPTEYPNEVTIVLTDGAIRNGNLSIRTARHLLPESVIGGSNQDDAAACRLTVAFHPGETVETDIAGDKMLLRCRGAVADFYKRSGVKRGDLVTMQRDRSGTLHIRVQ